VQPTSVKLAIQHSDDVPVSSIPFTADQILQTSVDDDFSEMRSEYDMNLTFHHDLHKTSSMISQET
jgi:hypothetical protein